MSFNAHIAMPDPMQTKTTEALTGSQKASHDRQYMLDISRAPSAFCAETRAVSSLS
jgi:hypothetical protein